MSAQRWHRALTALTAALTLAAVTACGPSESGPRREPRSGQRRPTGGQGDPPAHRDARGRHDHLRCAAGRQLHPGRRRGAGGRRQGLGGRRREAGRGNHRCQRLGHGHHQVCRRRQADRHRHYAGSDTALPASSTARVTVAPAAATAKLDRHTEGRRRQHRARHSSRHPPASPRPGPSPSPWTAPRWARNRWPPVRRPSRCPRRSASATTPSPRRSPPRHRRRCPTPPPPRPSRWPRPPPR